MTEKIRHFIDLDYFSKNDFRDLLNSCHQRKKSKVRSGKAEVDNDACAKDKILAMIFEKPSTRTRFSFEAAMYQLGGKSIVVNSNDMQLNRGETISDTAKVLSRYVDIVMLRTNEHSSILDFSQSSSVPVINGLSDLSHPCQVVADLMTFEEIIGPIKNKVVTWFGPGNNMTHSWIHAASLLDFELRVCAPKEYLPNAEIVGKAISEGAKIIEIDNPEEAANGSHCIVTDTWFSMGDKEDSSKREVLSKFQVTNKLISLADDKVIFLHCLPAHRGEEVDSQVIDGPHSYVWDEAENRLHAQKGIIDWCLNSN
jgi:ornithine carbamoyltransferase